METRAAAESGDIDEVAALLRLAHPELPVVFSAVSLGCPAVVRAVLERGEDPDAPSEGLSPLSLCVVVATATPMQPYAGMRCRPSFEMGTAVEIARELLAAGAAPKTEDLWLACHSRDAALGAVLLASGRGAGLVTGAEPRSWLSVAGACCPDLVFPLLDRGASLAEFGPYPGVLPAKIDPTVFREARWKLLRNLCLLHSRGCLAIPDNLLGVVGSFLAGPAPRSASDVSANEARNERARGEEDHHSLALPRGPLEIFSAYPLPPLPCLLNEDPFFLSVTPPRPAELLIA
jgi:hypothetical protein